MFLIPHSAPLSRSLEEAIHKFWEQMNELHDIDPDQLCGQFIVMQLAASCRPNNNIIRPTLYSCSIIT